MPVIDFQMKPTWRTFYKWFLLKALSLIYTGLVYFWLFLYQIGFRKGSAVNHPVISVGNITLGGTGKTPLVDWLLTFCEQSNLNPTVLTRGYGANRKEQLAILNKNTAQSGSHKNFGDEPWLLYQNHPQFNYLVSPNRVLAAKSVSVESDLIILDDGMQHLKLQRDLDIVLIDTIAGIGNGQVVPLGPLREPLSSLARADVIIYTKTNIATPSAIKEMIRPFFNQKAVEFDSEYRPKTLLSSNRQSSYDIKKITGKRCLLFSGIGNPDGFTRTIEKSGGIVKDHLVFGDHHDYDAAALDKIAKFRENLPHDFLICTEKDWVKLERKMGSMPEFFCLKMELLIDSAFNSFLETCLLQHGIKAKT